MIGRLARSFAVGLLVAAVAAAEESGLRPVEARSRIIVPVMIDERGPFSFLFDTALAAPVVTPAVASYLNATVSGQDQVQLKNIEFGSITAHDETALVRELAVLSQSLGLELAGLLPAHQAGHEVQFDFETPSVAWAPLDKGDLEKPESQEPPVLSVDAAGAPCARVLLNGKYLRSLRIDTVSPDTVALPAADLEAIEAIKPKQRRILPDGTLQAEAEGTPSPGTLLRLQRLSVAGATVEQPVCRVLEAGAPGYIGVGLLRAFRVALAYESGLFRLEPLQSGTLSNPPVGDFGIALSYWQEGHWRILVAPGSPAHEAGLRTEDALLKVGDLALDNAANTPGALAKEIERRLFAAPGASLEVRARGGEDRTVLLAARPAL